MLSILSSVLVRTTLELVAILLIPIQLMLSVLCSFLSIWMVSTDTLKSLVYMRFHSKVPSCNRSNLCLKNLVLKSVI